MDDSCKVYLESEIVELFVVVYRLRVVM